MARALTIAKIIGAILITWASARPIILGEAPLPAQTHAHEPFGVATNKATRPLMRMLTLVAALAASTLLGAGDFDRRARIACRSRLHNCGYPRSRLQRDRVGAGGYCAPNRVLSPKRPAAPQVSLSESIRCGELRVS